MSAVNVKNDPLLQETTLKKHLEVTQILQIFLKNFCEFRPWTFSLVGIRITQTFKTFPNSEKCLL
jgi:hypothetical protein